MGKKILTDTSLRRYMDVKEAYEKILTIIKRQIKTTENTTTHLLECILKT